MDGYYKQRQEESKVPYSDRNEESHVEFKSSGTRGHGLWKIINCIQILEGTTEWTEINLNMQTRTMIANYRIRASNGDEHSRPGNWVLVDTSILKVSCFLRTR